ncbi:MAG: IS1595 family transposase [Planctomycetes bacterium]|nr:IS1595 family transposase [Planctomycetota bacterium]
MQRYTIKQFNEDFPDEDACLVYVAALVYPTFPEIHCRTCGEVLKHHRLKGRKAFSCQRCGTHVYPLAGTIFEKSRTPLKSWFYAMYLMSTTRMGISAKQLERELGVTYKTAWRMFTEIRKLMHEDPTLSGQVEFDEMYVGGRIKGQRGRPGLDSPKTPVVGGVERGGRAFARITRDARLATIMPVVSSHLMNTADTVVYTDEHGGYQPLRGMGYRHETIKQSRSGRSLANSESVCMKLNAHCFRFRPVSPGSSCNPSYQVCISSKMRAVR